MFIFAMLFQLSKSRLTRFRFASFLNSSRKFVPDLSLSRVSRVIRHRTIRGSINQRQPAAFLGETSESFSNKPAGITRLMRELGTGMVISRLGIRKRTYQIVISTKEVVRFLSLSCLGSKRWVASRDRGGYVAVNRNRAVVMGSTSIRRELLDKPLGQVFYSRFEFSFWSPVSCLSLFLFPFLSIEIVRVFSLLSILFENCDF